MIASSDRVNGVMARYEGFARAGGPVLVALLYDHAGAIGVFGGSAWHSSQWRRSRGSPYTFHLEDLVIEARNINIHSKDTEVLYLPADHILLSGDTLEDELTYMVEFEGLADHVKNLRAMRQWDVTTFYPNHGDPETIRNGGYGKTFIDATSNYIAAMLMHSHDANFRSLPVEAFAGESLAKGWVRPFEPYREVHAQNLKGVHEYWKDRPLPSLQ